MDGREERVVDLKTKNALLLGLGLQAGPQIDRNGFQSCLNGGPTFLSCLVEIVNTDQYGTLCVTTLNRFAYCSWSDQGYTLDTGDGSPAR